MKLRPTARLTPTFHDVNACREAGFSLIEAVVATSLALIMIGTAISLGGYLAQGRLQANRAIAFADLARGLGTSLSDPIQCKLNIERASAGTNWNMTTANASTGTFQLDYIAVSSGSTLTTTGASIATLAAAHTPLSYDSQTYVKRIYLSNGASVGSGSSFIFQAYIELLHPAPPVKASAPYGYDEAAVPQHKAIPFTTVSIQTSGGTLNSGGPTCGAVVTAGSASSAGCMLPPKVCPQNFIMGYFDPSNNSAKCFPVYSGCYYNNNSSPNAYPQNLDSPIDMGAADACSPNTVPTGTLAGTCAANGDTAMGYHNCIIQNGHWWCHAWCAKSTQLMGCNTNPVSPGTLANQWQVSGVNIW